MVKIPIFDYPNIGVEEAIRCAKILVEKLGGEANKPDAYASLLGHKSAKSGTFLVKIGDLRKYGLLEPRGVYKATELAKRITHPLNNDEKQIALNEIIMNIELWKILYNDLKKDYPPDNEFWIHLMNATGKDRSEAIKYADEIRKKYKEAMIHFEENVKNQDSSNDFSEEIQNKKGKEESRQSPSSYPGRNSNMTEIKFEEISISFPKDDVEAAETAKELIEMQIKKLRKRNVEGK